MAGRYPNRMPNEQVTRKANPTEMPEMGMCRFPGRKGWISTGMLVAITMPMMAPVPLMMKASIRNWYWISRLRGVLVCLGVFGKTKCRNKQESRSHGHNDAALIYDFH